MLRLICLCDEELTTSRQLIATKPLSHTLDQMLTMGEMHEAQHTVYSDITRVDTHTIHIRAQQRLTPGDSQATSPRLRHTVSILHARALLVRLLLISAVPGLGAMVSVTAPNHSTQGCRRI